MKKISALILAVIMVLLLVGCKGEPQKITINDFDKILNSQPVVITNTELIVQTGNLSEKVFSPDMLTATFRNCTDKVIDYVQIAFVAWDKDGAPVSIKSPDEKGYDIKAVQYKKLGLESGRYYGKGVGIELEPNHNIASFKAIVVMFKTADGESWENPYFETFRTAYVSKQFRKSLMIDFKEKKDDFKRLNQNQLAKTDLTEELLSEKTAEFSVEMLGSKYLVRGEDKDAAPDAIKTYFANRGEKEITNVILGVFGFDENGKAVKLIEAGDNASDGNYLALISYTTKDFTKGVIYGENDLYEVHEKCGIKYTVAVLKSYTDIDGKTFENPYFIDYCLIYEGGEIDIVVNEPVEPEAIS